MTPEEHALGIAGTQRVLGDDISARTAFEQLLTAYGELKKENDEQAREIDRLRGLLKRTRAELRNGGGIMHVVALLDRELKEQPNE